MAPLPAGTPIGRYEILSALGAGGMGEVYVARDTQLDRQVAIKLLPSAYTQHAERVQRFVQEAKAASALNHPNIITVHEIGRTGDRHFIATELIEGQTLRQRITHGPLPIDTVLDLAGQIAGALAASHAAGVVHRDIKPENVMVRPDGYVKVLDFGLAKLLEASPEPIASSMPTREDLRTEPGAVMGTARYMSPEQARGLPVDARTDVFSLGVVLYEMIAGHAPFDGATTGDLILATLDREPPPLARVRPETPVELERMVAKALRKDRDERYQTVRELQVDLKNLKQERDLETRVRRGGVTSPAASTIAPLARRRRGMLVAAAVVVLAAGAGWYYASREPALSGTDTILLADFVNETGEPTFDGNTLKQALTANLRQTPFLHLFPEEGTRETLRMMGRPVDARVTRDVAREISQRERLKALLVGTIASLGRNYVVTLEAFNAQTGETIATEQVEAPGKEQVLTAIGQAATGLRKSLGESLSTIQQYNAPMDRVTTSSLEALKAYSTGSDQFLRGDARGALPLIQRAIELDPDFAGAHDTLAWIYVNLNDGRRAIQSAENAYALRDRVTELEKLYLTSTYHHWVTGDWETENDTARLAQRLYPNDWTWPHVLALNYTSTGRDDEALAVEAIAARLNPNVAHVYRFQAIALMHLNRFEEAKQLIRDTQARKLDGPFFRQTLFAIAVAQGDETGIRRQLELIRMQEGERSSLAAQARTAATGGRWREALSLYRRVADAAPPRAGPAPLPLDASLIRMLFSGCQTDDPAGLLAPSRVIGPTQRIAVPLQADGSLCGNAGEAQTLVDDMTRRFQKGTMIKGYSVPVLGAAIALQRGQPERAIEQLKAAVPYERGWTFVPAYLRGQAYLRLGKGADAAAEFERILAHRGWDPLSVLFPLAHLGRARAAALVDADEARKRYDELFQFWKDADQDLPILVDARREYARLRE